MEGVPQQLLYRWPFLPFERESGAGFLAAICGTFPTKAAKTKPNSNLSPDFHNPNTA
jgi:hypothetical protein